MTRFERDSDESGVAEDLIVEIIRSALVLDNVFDSVLEVLPNDAFPGEDPPMVILEMAAGSAQPAIDAAGEDQCREAIALIGAVVDRVMSDLRKAVSLAE